jgi:integrase
MFQEWINWNERRDISPSTIKVVFSNLRKYLFYRKIRTNQQDIREHLRFPKTPKEEKHPLSDYEYRAIVDAFAKHPLYQLTCLALGSSGMRIGKLMNIKKKDLDLSTKRITVKIPANTKTRTGRTTFFTKEVEEKIKKRLGKLDPDDYVFCKKSPYSGQFSFSAALRRILILVFLEFFVVLR